MSIIERRLRERQRRIEGILDAAKVVFLSKGFSSATMNDIADESELSRRTLYHYFRSKEEVSLAAAELTLEQLLASIRERVSGEETGIRKLIVMLDTYQNMFKSDPGNFQYIVNFPTVVRSLQPNNTSVKKCLSTISALTNLVKDCIQEGMRDGTVRQIETDSRTAAIVLVGMVNSIMQNAVSDKDLVRMATGLDSSVFLDEAFSYFHHFLSPQP